MQRSPADADPPHLRLARRQAPRAVRSAAESAAALAEVDRVADEHEVDLVLVSGDVFDRPIPPVDALALGLAGCFASRRGGPWSRSPATTIRRSCSRRWRRCCAARRSSDRRDPASDEGGVLGPDVLGVPARRWLFPFLREGHVVDFMRDAGEWYRPTPSASPPSARRTTTRSSRGRGRRGAVLVAHFMVGGVKVARPRGERELHMGGAYAATAQAIPAGPQYVAIGHIHAPQAVPGAPVPAEYAGSLLALDFGEAGEQKRVVIVDAEPGRLATVTSIPSCPAPARPRRRDMGRDRRAVEEFARRTSTSPCASAGSTRTSGRAPGTFPFLVHVRPSGTGGTPRPLRGTRRATRSCTPTLTGATGEEPPPDLLDLLRDVLEEAGPMRPLELTVEGFRSYRGRTTFDCGIAGSSA